MFDAPYAFQKLDTTQTFQKNPTEVTHYRFVAAKRKYFVTFEIFDFNVAAVKYCDLKDHKSPRTAYKKIFNDGDAIRIIGTCLYIMLHYWKHHPSVSFDFYAVPKDQIDLSGKGEHLSEKKRDMLLERYERVRYYIYRYAMVNLFSPQSFRHFRDDKSSIYVLLNRKEFYYQDIIKRLATHLLSHFNLLFDPNDERDQDEEVM